MKTSHTADEIAARVSGAGIVCNAFLFVVKLLAGLFAHSGALVSDAIHSASDIVSAVFLLLGIRLAARPADEEHPFGHERFECLAALVPAILLGGAGLAIIRNAVMNPSADAQPVGAAALAAAALSVAVKEGMYRYTEKAARRLNSAALEAGALDHRSDAAASLGVLVGAAGARQGCLWADRAAELLISCFLLKAAADIFADAAGKLVDHACPAELADEIRAAAEAVPGVLAVDGLRTREFGSRLCAELTVKTDGDQPLRSGRATTEAILSALREKFPQLKHITVMLLPEEDRNTG